MMCNNDRMKIWGLTLAAVSFFVYVLLPSFQYFVKEAPAWLSF